VEASCDCTTTIDLSEVLQHTFGAFIYARGMTPVLRMPGVILHSIEIASTLSFPPEACTYLDCCIWWSQNVCFTNNDHNHAIDKGHPNSLQTGEMYLRLLL
jgi:hypothetical protein